MTESEVEDFMRFVLTPRRRARPRLAEPLRDALDVEVDAAQGPVAAWRMGEGPAILCVHGWEDDNALWGPFLSLCRQAGRAAVVLDLPAHGFSHGEICAAPDAADAILAVAAQLGPIDALAAHSFGGPCSVLAMTRGLRVARAAFIACPLGRMRRWQRIGSEIGADPALIEAARTLYAQRYGAVAQFDVCEAAPRLSARALFVHSVDDEQVDADSSREAAAAWPDAALLLLDGLGHRLIAQDDAVLMRVFDFLDAI